MQRTRDIGITAGRGVVHVDLCSLMLVPPCMSRGHRHTVHVVDTQ